MINISFRPVDKSKARQDGKVQLYIHFTKDSKRAKAALPLRVELKYWSQTKQKALPKAAHSTLLNQEITKYKQIAEQLYTPTMDVVTLKQLFTEKIKGSATKNKAVLVNYIDYYIKNNRGIKKDESLNAFASLKANLKLFNDKLNINTFSQSDLEGFISFLINERQLNNNYVARLKTNLKTVLKYAKKKGDIINNLVDFDIKIKTYDSDTIYLTEEDLYKIKQCRLSTVTLDMYRDLLLLACHTGLRNSDLSILKKENVKQNAKGKWYLEIVIVKTDKRRIVPVSDEALSILEKYNFNIPSRALCNNNKSYKKICQEAGINDVVVIVSHVGGSRIEEQKEKWELVGTHTCRRTFATLVYNRTKNIKLVSKLLGHASIETTSKYLKLDDDELFEAFG